MEMFNNVILNLVQNPSSVIPKDGFRLSPE
jgi:hypothetical protein